MIDCYADLEIGCQCDEVRDFAERIIKWNTTASWELSIFKGTLRRGAVRVLSLGMNIFELEEKLGLIDDDRYVNILQLVIEAVNDYPTDVSDTEDYFKEIIRLLGKAEITLSELKLLSDKVGPGTGFGEHGAWIAESVTGLLEAFDIMRIHKITFAEVLEKIESLK